MRLLPRLPLRQLLPAILLVATGYATAPPAPDTTGQPAPRRVDPKEVARLSRLLTPLLGVADHPRELRDIQVGFINDPGINAASGGEGKFFVTRGLLERASDEQPMSLVAPAFGKLEETEVMFTTGSQPRRYVYGYTVPAGDLRLVFPDFKTRYRPSGFGIGRPP